MSGAYYNEIDPFAAAWLRELIKAGLIADGEVDERSIELVRPEDVRGFTQCHFFAGIGGWSYALRLAGWPDSREVWTGSCPCQRHSSATRGRGVARDWAPEFIDLIETCRPRVVFGEQVATAGAWLDDFCDCCEDMEYAVLAAVLPAYSVALDHARERIYFACDTNSHGESGLSVDAEVARLSRHHSDIGDVVSADGLSNDVALLRGFGNAIIPQVAQVFIEAYMQVTA